MAHCQAIMGLVRPAGLLLGALLAFGVNGEAPAGNLAQLPGQDSDFERCRAIKEDSARLRCYEEALPNRADKQQPSVAGTWRLVRTPNPTGGADAISIIQTADISRSDLDLAGLMIRCAETTTEVLIVLVRPFPPRARPQVTIGTGSKRLDFTASVAPPGLMLLLPPEANALAAGSWQTEPELTIEVADEHAPIHGVVPLTGIGPALRQLRLTCASK
jgi:hypothetical protein